MSFYDTRQGELVSSKENEIFIYVYLVGFILFVSFSLFFFFLESN